MYFDAIWPNFAPVWSMFSPTHCSFPLWYPSCLSRMNPAFASKQHILRLHHLKKKKNLICFQCDWNWHAAPCGYMLCFSLSLWIIQQKIETYLSVTPCKLHNCKTELLNKNRSAAALHERATFIFTFIFFFLTGLEIQMVKKHKPVTSREET